MTAPEVRWASKRLAFHVYIGFCLLTVVGGFLTAPLFTRLFFGDWRFWRHFNPGWKLFLHGWSFLIPLLRWENAGFMLAVPLASPPYSAPPRHRAQLSDTWEHGTSCGDCTRCCDKISCPILDTETGLCKGYDSPFWQYFNCGRFPSTQPEIDYYGCPKWVMRPRPAARPAVALATQEEALQSE